MTETLCPAPRHDKTGPEQTLPGLRLCGTCLTRLETQLVDVAVHRAALPAFTQPGAPKPGASSSGKRPSPPAPGRLDVLAATDPRSKPEPGSWPVDATIHRWFAHWMRAMNAKPPYTRDVLTQLAWMLRSAEWTATFPAVTEYASDVNQTSRALRALTGDTPPPAAGRCINTDPEGQPCRGPLRLQGARHVRCPRCGKRWHVNDLPDLIASLIHPDQRVPLQTAWIAANHSIPERTIRHWASTGLIRRYGRGIVDYGDVQRLLQARSEAS